MSQHKYNYLSLLFPKIDCQKRIERKESVKNRASYYDISFFLLYIRCYVTHRNLLTDHNERFVLLQRRPESVPISKVTWIYQADHYRIRRLDTTNSCRCSLSPRKERCVRGCQTHVFATYYGGSVES